MYSEISGHPWDRKVSLIERCPHFRGPSVHNTNVIQWNLYSGHPWDRKVSLIERCPHFRGPSVHNTNVCDSTSCPDKRGVLNSLHAKCMLTCIRNLIGVREMQFFLHTW